MIRLRKPHFLLAALLFCVGNLTAQLVADNNNAFALEFYALQRTKTAENIVFSPFSLVNALGMIYPGARSATADQIKTTFHFHGNRVMQTEQFHSLLTKLTADGSALQIANAMWVQKGFPVEQDFLDLNKKYFDSNFRQADFAAAPDSVRMAINASIEEQTREKIKHLLPPGSVNPMTKLVLTNAIYFKNAWATRFDPGKTKDRDFFIAPGKPVTAKFMEMEREIFPFFENESFKAIELPYQDGKFSMLILLPKTDMITFENAFDVSRYNSMIFTPVICRTLQIPKFKIDNEVQPIAILKQLGMTDAFAEGEADFSGISKVSKLFISGIFHKAFIEVNEEGTEAAAATAVLAQPDSIIEQETTFIANKPFVFILRDRLTNCILFIGNVKDPTK